MQRKLTKLKKRHLKKFGGSEVIDGEIRTWSPEEGIKRIKEIGFKSKNSLKRAKQSQTKLNEIYQYLKEQK